MNKAINLREVRLKRDISSIYNLAYSLSLRNDRSMHRELENNGH